jgi:hypothetical protein
MTTPRVRLGFSAFAQKFHAALGFPVGRQSSASSARRSSRFRLRSAAR